MPVQPQTAPQPAAPLGRNWRKIAIASLAFNLLLIGIGSSALWRHRQPAYPGSGGIGSRGTEEIGLQSFLRTLQKPRAKELRALLKSEKPDLKPLFENTRAARRAAADIIAAEPFDKDKLTAAFGKIDEAEASVKAAARSVITTAAGHMSADERKLLAERWKTRRSRLFKAPSKKPDAAPK